LAIFRDPIEEAVGGLFSPKSLFLSIRKDIKRLLELHLDLCKLALVTAL
jgi:hypothetical protein